MLKKERRLSSDREIRRVFRRQRPIKSRHLSLRALRRREGELSRFCFVVSNKIDKSAAKRNALKRQLREIIRLNLDDIKEGFDIVIQVINDFDRPLEQEEIREEMMGLLDKAGLLKKVADKSS